MKKAMSLTPLLTGITLLTTTLLPSFGTAQNTSHFIAQEKPIMATEYNAGNEKNPSRETTEFYGDQYLNPYVQPNLLNGGNFDLTYYGSGDVTGDNQITWEDYDVILGSNSEQADIDGDGTPGTQADKDILEDYLLDNIPYLPAHWEFQNTPGKEAWFQNYYNNVDHTEDHPPGPDWDCDQYSIQYQINSSGVENIEGSPFDSTLYDFSNNAQGNMPVYIVSTISGNNVAHTINATFVGDDPTNFYDWYFYEPQNDTRVYPGDISMQEDSFAHIEKYAYVWSEIDNQYLYVMANVIEFNLDNGNPSITWQHPDLVEDQPIEQTYKHLGGEMPGDTLVNYGNGTDPSITGDVTGLEDWATAYYNDESTQESGDWNPAHYNYEILRSWRAESDFSSLIDTTYGSTNPVYGRDPQVITVQDTIRPWFTYVQGDQEMFFSEYSEANQSTGADNSGFYAIDRDINSNQGTDPYSCDFYNFNEVYNDSIYDPSGNNRDTTFTFSVTLDPNQWDEFPEEANLHPEDNTDPDYTGWATAFNPAGVGVEVTYEDESTQGDPGTCEYVNYTITRTWTATDSICNTSIDSIQYINVTPEENVWDSFPDDWQGQYSQNLDLSPENTGGYAQASNPGGLEVIVTYEDDSGQSSDPLNCAHYNFDVDRTWTALEEFCGTYIQDVQELEVTKPMSLLYDSFPEDIDVDEIDPWEDPAFTGEPTGEDTLAPQIPVSYVFSDEIVEDYSTYFVVNREFELHEDVCGTQTDSDSTQVITVYKEVGTNNNSLENLVEIYPNPVSDMLNIQCEVPFNLVIYNQLGQPVIKSDSHRINVSRLSQGVYFIKITSARLHATAYYRMVKR